MSQQTTQELNHEKNDSFPLSGGNASTSGLRNGPVPKTNRGRLLGWLQLLWSSLNWRGSATSNGQTKSGSNFEPQYRHATDHPSLHPENYSFEPGPSDAANQPSSDNVSLTSWSSIYPISTTGETMSDSNTNLANTALQTAVDTAKTLAPVLVTAAMAGSAAANPGAAATVAALAPIAMQLLNNAMMLSQAGAMSDAELAQLFSTIGRGISATQAQWDAMNNAQATKAA